MNNKSQFEFENDLIKTFLRLENEKQPINFSDKNELDWEYIFLTAEEHRVVPLLFNRIKMEYADQVPDDVYVKFQDRFQEIAAFNFARSTQLIKLVKLLQNHNFPVLSYKGMTLAELAYKDVTLRQFTDIDLLVEKKDFPKIKQLLLANDCRSVWNLTEKQEKSVLKYDYEYPFYYGNTNTLLEVHWDFVESFFAFDYETEKLWERIETVKLYGKNIPTLSSVDYLIVLSSHGSKHFWKRLSWICDIDRLVRNTEIDWDLVVKQATETGSLRMVWLGLYLSKDILKTKLPKEIDQKIVADENVEFLGGMLLDNMFEEEREPADWKEMAKIHLLMREDLRTKLKYSHRLFTTKLIDKLFMPLGRPR